MAGQGQPLQLSEEDKKREEAAALVVKRLYASSPLANFGIFLAGAGPLMWMSKGKFGKFVGGPLVGVVFAGAYSVTAAMVPVVFTKL